MKEREPIFWDGARIEDLSKETLIEVIYVINEVIDGVIDGTVKDNKCDTIDELYQ